MNKTIPKREP